MRSYFSSTHHQRTRALVLYAPLVKGTGGGDFPWALAPELQHMFGEQLPASWGSEPMARLLAGVVAPSLADDERFLQFLAKAMRSSVSPGAAQAWLRMIADIDVREALPQIRVPTLIVHRTGDRAVDVGASRYAAGRIPGARLVELAGGDNLPFVGDTEAGAAEIEEFLTVPGPRRCRIGSWPRSCSPTSPVRPNAPPRWAIADGGSCSGATTPWPERSWSGTGVGR
jgi:pimeloyl-ACP methyl ester carboxylesterase